MPTEVGNNKAYFSLSVNAELSFFKVFIGVYKAGNTDKVLFRQLFLVKKRAS